MRTWNTIEERLKTSLPGHIYQSLIASLETDFKEPEGLSLYFPDDFTKEQFREKCLTPLKTILDEMRLDSLPLYLLLKGADRSKPPESIYIPSTTRFDSKYTFDSFVVGGTNQFAHAASIAVAKQPGLCYNPLFVFGGAGLGKTHLLKAIGYELSSPVRNLKVLFLTSENFTNEMIQAIRLDRMKEFREKYRTHCDVLLLDDIHFLAGKERTQEEFFYTFNYLHEARKQIVITSDRYPKDIQGLENRLQTRFEWGLVADVQPPEIETRIAILKNKADLDGIDLPDSVAEYIAAHITSNIRELEGSLNRLQAYSALHTLPISMDLAERTLKDIVPKVKHELTADAILKLVALEFNVSTVDLKSDKRIRKLSVPRQVCMYLLRKHLLLSFPEIGKFMGGKDHTTIMHGVNKIAEQMRFDSEILKHTVAIEGLFR